MEIDANYIPTVQVWGNGDIVWVEYSPIHHRKVFEGHLTQQQIKQLIQKLIGLGVFRRLDFSDDYGWEELSVTLLNNSIIKTLSQQNSPLYEFANYLRSGAGAQGIELSPTTGTLMVVPMKEKEYNEPTSSYYKPTTDDHWPDEKFGYSNLGSLFSKDTGEVSRDISGDELKFAWDVVNNNPNSLVESNGKIYWIAVILPKISGH